MKKNHVIIVIFYVANMSFNDIRENKILAKISEFYSKPVHEIPVSIAPVNNQNSEESAESCQIIWCL